MEQVFCDTAKKSDILYLKKMWKDIFKDEDNYIDLFFSYKFKEDLTFVIRENGKIVSTLYAEYTDVYIDSEIYKGVYFCGIATLSECRKRGYAKKLIEFAKENVKDADLIYLIPANQPLFDFYKESGFEIFTYLDKEKVYNDELIRLENFSEEFDYAKLKGFYENSGSDLYIKRDESFFKAIYDCYKNIMIFDDGYVIYYIDNDILQLTEYSFSYERAKEILKGILGLKSLKEGILYKKYGNTPFSVCITDLNIESIDKKYVNLMLN